MEKLLDIIKILRSPNGCPWDRKQTHKSLIPYVLEETWEVIDEIDQGNLGESLAEELGDLLLQIVLHARIAEEEQRFTFDDIVEAISTKMIRRHPHVFDSDQKILSDKELSIQWQSIKDEEKPPTSISEGIPESAPALMNALKISKRAAGLGFDWETPWDVLSKVEEELEEVKNEMELEDINQIEQELGDLLFSIVNLARKYKINPEIALKKGNTKFAKRFSHIELAIRQASENGSALSMDEMQRLWVDVKSKEI